MREPWPNQAAFDLGCSRDCRIEHSYQWGRCALAVAPPPKLNLHAFEIFTASDGHQSMRYRPVTAAEALAEIERFRTATEEATDAR
jgi:hypothetical protein